METVNSFKHMEQKENKVFDKVIEYISIAIVIYFILWFWPILFGRSQNVENYPKPYPMPYSYGGGYVNGPTPSYNYNPDIKVIPIESGYSEGSGPVKEVKLEPVPVEVSPSPVGTACTMEAKLCDDGSYVGRSGPNCEFDKCPGEK